LLKAETEYLESLRETTKNVQKEPTAIKVSDSDLEYLREQSTKAILSKEPVRTVPEYGHKVPKTINVNVDLSLYKDLDIDKIVEYMSKELKEGIKL
jgi:hypothetical protein